MNKSIWIIIGLIIGGIILEYGCSINPSVEECISSFKDIPEEVGIDFLSYFNIITKSEILSLRTRTFDSSFMEIQTDIQGRPLICWSGWKPLWQDGEEELFSKWKGKKEGGEFEIISPFGDIPPHLISGTYLMGWKDSDMMVHFFYIKDDSLMEQTWDGKVWESKIIIGQITSKIEEFNRGVSYDEKRSYGNNGTIVPLDLKGKSFMLITQKRSEFGGIDFPQGLRPIWYLKNFCSIYKNNRFSRFRRLDNKEGWEICPVPYITQSGQIYFTLYINGKPYYGRWDDNKLILNKIIDDLQLQGWKFNPSEYNPILLGRKKDGLIVIAGQIYNEKEELLPPRRIFVREQTQENIWGPVYLISNAESLNPDPIMVVDNNDNIYILWTSYKKNCLFIRARLNSEWTKTTTLTSYPYMDEAMCVDDKGFIHITWATGTKATEGEDYIYKLHYLKLICKESAKSDASNRW